MQQIQLLGRDMKGPAHDKLWNQLEAEIHLHRHKTVIRACRGRNDPKKALPSPAGHVRLKTQIKNDPIMNDGFQNDIKHSLMSRDVMIHQVSIPE